MPMMLDLSPKKRDKVVFGLNATIAVKFKEVEPSQEEKKEKHQSDT